MIKIILCGYNGAMGKHLVEQITSSQHLEIACGIDRHNNSLYTFTQFNSFEECTIDGDVIVDFSHHTVVPSLLKFAVSRHIPAVICTTGLSEETKSQIEATSKEIAIFQSGNMSLGINLLLHLAKKATEVLGQEYDIEIIEKHHHRKLDAPSGTALMIADAVNESAQGRYAYQLGRSGTDAKRQTNEIGIHAVRGGNIVGEHDVIFAGLEEIITLRHSAASRGVFAKGALRAAEFLVKKPAGLYNMDDMLSNL